MRHSWCILIVRSRVRPPRCGIEGDRPLHVVCSKAFDKSELGSTGLQASDPNSTGCFTDSAAQSRARPPIERVIMTDSHCDLTRQSDGVNRHSFLKCMAWAGTGLLWSVGDGVPTSPAWLRACSGEQRRVLIRPDQRQPYRVRQRSLSEKYRSDARGGS